MNRLRLFSLIAAVGLLSALSSVNATIYAIDDFNIIKNGSPFFNDPFSDGTPPPSSEGTFPSGAPGSYLTKGTPSETGGKVFMDTATGAIGTSPLNGVSVSTHRSRLITNISNTDLGPGLKSDDTFTVSGLFDFVLPEFGDRYGIRLADWDAPPAGPAGVVDVVELVLERAISGDIMVRFAKYDFGLGIRDPLGLWNLTNFFNTSIFDINDFDQIEFFLEKPDDASPAINGFFNIYDYDAPVTVNGIGAPSVDIFTAYEFTRAEFIAFRVGSVPEPATMLLMGLGLAGLGFAQRKKA